MERRHIAIAAAAVVVLALLVGAFLTGFGPAPGGGNGDDIEQFPTETTTAGSSGSDGASASGTTTEQPPFAFEIDQIEECGNTCRDVTATLYNNQNHTAENVTVYTRIYVGNSTAESDVIWQGKEPVGTMAADGSDTATQRVELSYQEGYEVRQHDGWITIVTTVQSENVTVTFQNRRDVA